MKKDREHNLGADARPDRRIVTTLNKNGQSMQVRPADKFQIVEQAGAQDEGDDNS